MKKILITAVFVIFGATGASAQYPFMRFVQQDLPNNLGGNPYAFFESTFVPLCGPGTVVFGSKYSWVSSFSELTLNSMFAGFSTFSWTSNVSGCKGPKSIVQNKSEEVKAYVAKNFDDLTREIAQGDGQSLVGLADLFQIQDSDRANFYSALKGNFARIFKTGKEDIARVVDGIVDVTWKEHIETPIIQPIALVDLMT